MKRENLQMSLALLLSLLVISCEGGTESDTKQAEIFEIHLQSGFAKNQVQLKFDNELVFYDTVSTSSIVAYAAIIPLDVFQGIHYIQVFVDNKIQGDTTVLVGESLYVAVQYNSNQKTIEFYAQNMPFPYK